MKKASINTLLNDSQIKVLFCDYFDSLVHRTVHPNYTLRIWAKIIIREFGLNGSIDSLYFVRRESSLFLKGQLNCSEIEIPYNSLKKEVFKRLQNNLVLQPDQRDKFLEYFELADLQSELMVQYSNPKVIQLLEDFKAKGGKLYLISDFYASLPLFNKMLVAHKLDHIFDGVYCSAAIGKSKQNGTIYEAVLNDLSLNKDEVVMMGDNKVSDYKNAIASGIRSVLLPHQGVLLKNKFKGIGSDKNSLKKAIKKTRYQCINEKNAPLSEYIIFAFFFVERLYLLAKKFRIKNLFFLSREGLFLKELFEKYQTEHILNADDKINTHYLRISRQSAIRINLNPLQNEEFAYLRKHFESMSAKEFLNFFDFSDEEKYSVEKEVDIPFEETVIGFFDSSSYERLIKAESFQTVYEQKRNEQKKAFMKYLDSFGVDYKQEGLNLVDVGWGGTMQESIYRFFDEEISVQAFYIGLKKNYNINKDTKRFGLLFSIQPYKVYSDHILMANTQFYEQLFTAPHGGVVGYDLNRDEIYVEKENDIEKELFNDHISGIQKHMRKVFGKMIEEFKPLCYDYDLIQRQLTDHALKTGLILNSRKLKFINSLNKGFYQNLGVQQEGIFYKSTEAGSSLSLLKRALIQPESIFRYLVKLKPTVYTQFPVLAQLVSFWPVYYYFLLNRFIREKLLKRRFFLQYNYFK